MSPSHRQKKATLRWLFLWEQITAWLAQKRQRQVPLREQQLLQKRPQRVREPQREQPREQELLLFYRKQPGQQQR